jgi:hypothetical protein
MKICWVDINVGMELFLERPSYPLVSIPNIPYLLQSKREHAEKKS